MQIAVIGAGYVGLTISACWARMGHQVMCVESDPNRLSTIQQGKVPFFEPELQDLVAEGVARGSLCATDAFGDAVGSANVVFIAVGTPSRPTGEPDLSAINAVTDALRRAPRADRVVGIKSTVPVGTTDRIADALRGTGPAHVAHTPEFLAEGTAVSDFFHPYRVIIGTRSKRAGCVLSSLYQPLGCPILVTDPCTSEMTKYASNTFLATKVSFINQIAALCERTGADVATVASGMGLDPRIGPYFFKAGVGFGGSCLPKDTRALIALAVQCGLSPALFDTVLRINEAQRDAFVEKVRSALGELSGKRVAVFGLAFKGGTSDVRESPAVDITGRLVAEGAAVRAFDPAAEDAAASVVPGLVCCPDPYEAAEGADAIAILTDWQEFAALDWGRLRRLVRQPLVLDGRGGLSIAKAAAAAGFVYTRPGAAAARPGTIAAQVRSRPAPVRDAARG